MFSEIWSQNYPKRKIVWNSMDVCEGYIVIEKLNKVAHIVLR